MDDAAQLSVEPDFLIVDQQVLSFGPNNLTAIHTPGHTPGSTCFLLEVDGEPPILFSGDHLFAGSIGRTDFPGSSHEQLMQSMAEKILPLDDEIPVLPGHGPTTTIGRERHTNPFVLELLASAGERERPASRLWVPNQPSG